MFPIVPLMEVPQKPSHGQLDDRTMTILSEDRRPDNWVLDIGSHLVCQVRKRSKWVDGICLLYSDSLYLCHDQPITLLTTIGPLLSWPTHRSEGPHQYWYCWIVSWSWFPWPPMLMNLCSMFRFFFVIIASYRTFLSRLWWLCLLSAPLWCHCLHIPYCYLFLANWSVCCPALNFLVYN